MVTGRGAGKPTVGVTELVGEQKDGGGGGERESRGQTARGQLLIGTTPSRPCRTHWSEAKASDEARQHAPPPPVPFTAACCCCRWARLYHLHLHHTLKEEIDGGEDTGKIECTLNEAFGLNLCSVLKFSDIKS